MIGVVETVEDSSTASTVVGVTEVAELPSSVMDSVVEIGNSVDDVTSFEASLYTFEGRANCLNFSPKWIKN